jgi:Na+-translocating ferredoxin:NAD+ oxidoreductase subunit C
VKGIVTFSRGGLHIPEKAKLGDFDPISNAFIPPTAIVALKDNPRVKVQCLAYAGQEVEECQIIGRTETVPSANVHSPIPGRVREIRNIVLPDGSSSQAVVIDLGGSFSRLGKRQEFFPWKSLSASEIDHILCEKGVIDLSRDPASLHPILHAAKKKGRQNIILNAIDPEPYGLAEILLCAHRPKDVAMGAEIALKACGASRVILAMNARQKEHYESLLAALEALKVPCEALELDTKYPQGFDSQIRCAARSLPQKAFPQEELAGAPILNPSTLVAVYEAVALNKAFVERTITIAGDAIKNPATLKVRVGMRIGDLIEECGGFKGSPERLVISGSMTGFAIKDLDSPVMKTTTSILALTDTEIKKSRASACIRCARCIEACPESLNPDKLFRLIRFSRTKEAVSAGLARCTLCAACGYICPSRVPLVDTFSRALAAMEGEGSAHG